MLGVLISYGWRSYQKRSNKPAESTNSGLIQDCPDEWINNQMPRVAGDARENEYFIINGERKELEDYDLFWIRANCAVNKAETVY